MAKKKDTFDNLVDESFDEGYTSEPETVIETNRTAPIQSEAPANEAPALQNKRPLTENEIFLRDILAKKEPALNKVWEKTIRRTVYLSDFLYACVEIESYKQNVPMTRVIETALKLYFNDAIKEEARERSVEMAIKHLREKIEQEQGADE